MKRVSYECQLVYLVSRVRQDHPGMGLRDIYFKIQPEGIGRDRFEGLCKEQRLVVTGFKNHRKTTDSSGVIRFENLIKDLEIKYINQVWQSDITYYEVEGKFYYITLIQDTLSKLIVGFNVSDRLLTEHTTLPSLKMAITRRRGQPLKGLILHSDGGGQYYDKGFLELIQKQGIVNSVGEYAWENGMAERLNGVVKNNYLKYRAIKNFSDLQREVDRTVSLYNQDKPHSKLKRMTPEAFEKKVVSLVGQTRATVTE